MGENKNSVTFTAPVGASCADTLNTSLKDYMKNTDIKKKYRSRIAIITDSIVSDILDLGIFSASVSVSVTLTHDDDSIVLVYKDNAAPYDPFAQTSGSYSLSASLSHSGGLGIYAVRKLSDVVSYSRQGIYNVRTVIIKT